MAGYCDAMLNMECMDHLEEEVLEELEWHMPLWIMMIDVMRKMQ